MDFIKPLIISDSLQDALAQISQLRERLKVALTYNGKQLTPKIRDKLLSTLDEMEREEIEHARDREKERLSRAKEKFDSAINQRAVALAEANAAASRLANSVAQLVAGHTAATEAAKDAGTEPSSIRPDIQKLAQLVAEALKPLATSTESAEAEHSRALSEVAS